MDVIHVCCPLLNWENGAQSDVTTVKRQLKAGGTNKASRCYIRIV